MKNQLDRATLSVILNLAEGSAKPTPAERRRFYSIAFASFRESQAVLSVLREEKILEEFDILGGCLYKLVHKKPKGP